MCDQRIVQIRKPVLVDVLVKSFRIDTLDRSPVFPTDLVFVVVVAHDESATIQIDGLADRVIIVKSATVNGNFDATGFVLDGHVFVAVASLVGTDHHCFHDERLVPAADGVLCSGAQ